MGFEFDLIGYIRSRCAGDDLPVGIGDDAAQLHSLQRPLVCMDTVVEDIHFRRGWSEPEHIGWKSLAVNLSDIAAMGGRTTHYVLAIASPPATDQRWLERVIDGVLDCAESCAVNDQKPLLVGGDLTGSPESLMITVTAIGEAPKTGPTRRGGAEPGDDIWVLGELGLASVGLEVLSREDAQHAVYPRSIDAHRRPKPATQLGFELGRRRLATSMIDVSDGLLQDVHHLARESEISISVDAARVELPGEVGHHCEGRKQCEERHLLGGGEDFALALTALPANRQAIADLGRQWDVPAQRIGRALEKDSAHCILDRSGEPLTTPVAGYQHF